MAQPNTWWAKERLSARRANLTIRDRVRRKLRGFFDDQGFSEVETPILQLCPGTEPYLSVFKTDWLEPGRIASESSDFARPRFLHTSPEISMKKLLAGGETKIWQWARVFRNAEGSSRHQPEFVMIEWYRAGAGYEQIMEDCEKLLRACAVDGRYTRGSLTCDPELGCERLTVEAAFTRYASIDLRATYESNPLIPDADSLRDLAAAQGVRTDKGDAWDDVFFRIMDEKIEPHLGIGRPTILYDYPISMAALSRPKPEDPLLAERFELYVCGVELGNAFGELTDPVEQRRRAEADRAQAYALTGQDRPLDEEFIAAVGMMPECAGIALGFDRLVMLACGAENLEDVIWAPVT